MQGRGLQTFLIFMALSISARAQDDIGTAPSVQSSSTSEPDPSSALAPAKPRAAGSDEFSEFEEMGGAAAVTTPTTPATTPQEAPAPLPVEPSQALDTAPVISPSEVARPAPVPAKPTVFNSAPATPVEKMGGDEPDFAKEERLHRIYEKYNVQPTSEASWGKALSEGKGNIYQVQPGDTLWGISQTLFGDSQYWPKVWSINNDTFPNPHEITPSTKIQFFSGGLTDAPSLAVTPEEKPVVVAPPLAKNDVNANATPVEAATDTPAAVYPKPARKGRQLKTIPESLPLYRLGGVNKPTGKVEIINGFQKMPAPLVSLTHYVIEGELPSVGKVIEVENGSHSASLFQYVILEVSGASEKIFHIVQDTETVRSPFIKGGPVGHLIEVQGEVEVLEKVSEDKNYYRAIVRKAISPVRVGSQIESGPLPTVDVVQGPSEPAIEATLIGGQYSSDRQLYPRFSFVFVDAGTAGGLKAGQNLSVFANLKSRNSKTVVENRNRLVGHVKIIKTSENFSTGFVTEAFEELQMGDHVGGGATQSATEKKNPIEDSNMALEDTPDNAPEKPAEGSPDGGVEDSNSLEL